MTRYAVFRADGTADADLIYDSMSEAYDALEFLTGDKYTREEYENAYVGMYVEAF